MKSNSVFNATVCLIGIIILLVHTGNLEVKKEKRKDEKCLLVFFIFTIVHFATYLAFTIIKIYYKSDAYITAFYTTFYVMNNGEALLLFIYALSYIEMTKETKAKLSLFNAILFAVFVLSDIVNVFTGIYFYAQGGEYIRSGTMILSQAYQCAVFIVIMCIALSNKKLNVREKTAFATYCLLPFVAIILQNFFKGYAIAYASIIVSVEILFTFISISRNIELVKVQEKNKEAQIRIMMSQIQPHFMYNTLSSISTLIPMDPEKAQQSLDAFTEYLRHNLSSLTETRLIPFEEELKHIETYLSLEKMRFEDRINVIYNIYDVNFSVPALSIQPIVENSVKHGILKRIEGGTLTINVYQRGMSHVVEIIDDGVGFDISDVNLDGSEHVGLNNIKYRIESMCRGEIQIESQIGKGTKVAVIFSKQEKAQ
ncbi:MAG: histidine kinase [Clostridia bacterium]|nr:histidine kinase [Clostridia bacterium]